MPSHSRLTTIGIFLLSIMLLGTFSPTGLAGKGQERTVKKYSWGNEPVKIRMLKVKGAMVELGGKFTADDDWLRGLSFEVENTSGKPIVAVRLELIFFIHDNENSTKKQPLSLSLGYGHVPPVEGMSPRPDLPPAPPPVAPGSSVNLTFEEDDISVLKAAQRQFNYPLSVKDVEVNIDTVIFEGGDAWMNGLPAYRDPTVPHRWVHDKEQIGRPSSRNAPKQQSAPRRMLDFENIGAAFMTIGYRGRASPAFSKTFLTAYYTSAQRREC